MLAHEGVDARVDQGFEFDIIHSWEGEVEDVDGAGADGWEVSVEEDEVQDAYYCVLVRTLHDLPTFTSGKRKSVKIG